MGVKILWPGYLDPPPCIPDRLCDKLPDNLKKANICYFAKLLKNFTIAQLRILRLQKQNDPGHGILTPPCIPVPRNVLQLLK